MVPPTSPTGILRFQLIDPNNVTRELSRDFSPSIFVETGSAGTGGPSFNITDSKYPSFPGSLITQINTQTRIIQIPIVVVTESLADLINAADDLFDWFATGDETTNTPVKYRVTRPDDTVRQIIGYYTRGLEGDTKVGGPGWARYVVELYCPDPYPTDIEDTVVNTPMTSGSEEIGILNPGKLEAYPIFKINGPWQNFNLHNTTTDRIISVNHSAGGDEILYIDTRPSELRDGEPSVYDQDGTIRWDWISTPNSDFWTLISGTNVIELTTSFRSDATYVEVTYLPRYRSLFR